MKILSHRMISSMLIATVISVSLSTNFLNTTALEPVGGTPSSSSSSSEVYSKNSVNIDKGDISNGRVKVSYTGGSSSALKVRITCPNNVVYTYNIKPSGNYEVFPLTEGNGSYIVGVYQNVTGTKYAELVTQKISVTIKDDFAPFLLSNQYVSYSLDSKTVAKGTQLITGKATTLDKVSTIYNYVISTFTYDTNKATTVKSGYLPVVDTILESKKGICFDYAAVMATMLRSNNIPTKMIVGYSGDVYHAWLDVYTSENGWVNSLIFFDGTTWKLMDPTFASGTNANDAAAKEAMAYIGNGANYQAKYVY